MGVVSALDYLKQPQKFTIPSVCVIAGDEAFLRSVVFKQIRATLLSDQDADFSLSRFEGAEVTFKDVVRETAMTALFGSGRRLVVVEQADPFFSQNKEKLESYLDAPNQAGVLTLQLTSFPSTLRFYKKVSEKGLVIECKALPKKNIPAWLQEWAARNCQATLTREGAEVLVDLVGDDLGVLDQEVRRLSLLADKGDVNVNLIRDQVGTWRQRKVWDLVDAALGGQTAEAMRLLDKLIAAGEAPIAILAQMSASLRKLSAACEVFFEAGKNPDLPRPTFASALEQAGVPNSGYIKEKSIEQLKKLGSRRGRFLIQTLLNVDLDLKGGSRTAPRMVLERFIVQISAPQLHSYEILR